ncbi:MULTISPECIES: hypothetical protein [Acinetobacter]|jgi:hypothetical protein|uniref:hypothetical protein n=1 Tax=Acinetobacter TaxID=469 RepID=UPI000D00C389|nr:hypothetical protein [Acinetobacter sp. MYb10]QLD62141.1 hypothetical protein CQZ96_013045 [Acinetobacter sp. MYb10]
MKIKQKFLYKNSSSNKIKLVLEPWAEEFEVKPDSEVEIIIEGDLTKGYLMIESDNNSLIIYGWQGSLIQLYKDGELIY